MSKKWIKIIGLAATLIGFGASMASDWVKDKETDEKIAEAVKNTIGKKVES